MTPSSVHPVAAMFPMMEGRRMGDLVESIACLGLLEPIVLDGDVLVDGRNRLEACKQAGKEPRFVQWSSLGIHDVPVAEWILQKNLTRRDLTPDQRPVIWTRANEWMREQSKAEKARTQFKSGQSGNPTGRPKEQVNPKSGSPARDIKEMHSRSSAGKLAKDCGVSRYKAEQAIKLAEAAKDNPDAKEAMAKVESGAVKLAEAVKVIPPKPKREKTTSLRERVEAGFRKFLAQFSDEERAKVLEIVREMTA